MARGCVIAAAVLAGSALLTACSDDSKDTPQAESTTSAAPATTPAASAAPSAEDQAREQVLAAYAKYAAAVDKVQHEGRASTDDVSAFMAGDAKLDWQRTGINLEKDGDKIVGEASRTTSVTAVDLAGTPPRATITVCLDVSTVKLVHAATGEQVPTKQQAPRFVQMVTASQEGGVWRITKTEADRSRAC